MSARNGMVTRWETRVDYEAEYITEKGKFKLTKTVYGDKWDTAAIMAMEQDEIRKSGEKKFILSARIVNQTRHLYGQPREQFFASAVVLE